MWLEQITKRAKWNIFNYFFWYRAEILDTRSTFEWDEQELYQHLFTWNI